MEEDASGGSVEEMASAERKRSHGYGGRSVFGWEKP
jgi:hypothetical protein